MSRVTRVVAGRVGSGQEGFKISPVGSDRVGSSGFQSLAGWVWSSQEVFTVRGSGRVGSRSLEILPGRVGSRRLGILTGRDGSAGPTRPDPRDLTRPVKISGIVYERCSGDRPKE